MLTQLKKGDEKKSNLSVNNLAAKEEPAQMKSVSQLQQAANNSPQVQQLAQLQKGANSKNTPGLEASSGEPLQAKKEKEKPVEPKHNSDDFAKKTEKKKIKLAMNAAAKMITKAKSNVSKTNSKYKRWMDAGKVDTVNADKRVDHVKSGVEKIETVLKEEEVILKKYGLNDGEEDETYAYVYKEEEEHNIYLGGSFWGAKTSGFDSKAGTIIHELSHRVHDTDDHVYGKTDAKKLAKEEPELAVTNADNYEFLAEGS